MHLVVLSFPRNFLGKKRSLSNSNKTTFYSRKLMRRKLIVGTSHCIIDREHWTIGGRCSARYVIFSFLQLSRHCAFTAIFYVFYLFSASSFPPSLSPSLSLFLFLCLSASSITIKIFLTHGLSRPNSTFLFRGFLRCQSR